MTDSIRVLPSSPDDLTALGSQGLAAARAALERVLELGADVPGDEVLDAYDGIGRHLNGLHGQVGLAPSVHPDKAVREAAEQVQQELSAFGTELGMHRGLYERLAGVELGPDASADDRRLLEHSLRDFRRSGVDKDDATRERITALKEELVTVGQTFDRNIIEGGRTLELAGGHGDLAGLPADYLESHPEGDDGSVSISTDPTDALPVMLYAESDDVRRRMAVEMSNKAYPVNVDVLHKLLTLRHELAQALGYDTWADYVTEDKMVGSSAAASAFLKRVAERARPAADAEYAELLAELREVQPDAERVELHQVRYLEERVKRTRLAFDSQSVRPYLAYDRVQAGVLGVAERLYGVTFRAAPEIEVWHESVRAFEVLDGDRVMARFYLDMWPREGKYKHAAMFGLASGMAARGGNEEVLPEAALVCNFPEPSKDDPGLMLHSQVTTFFHEFGHLLHHLFAGDQRYLSFSGIATEWDFVEVPSQLFEEWAWDAGVLATFARHHETDEALPAELVQRLRSAEEYGKALQVSTQMVYATLSLELYSRDPKGMDPDAEMRRLRAEMTPFTEPEAHHFIAAFGHLHGYSAIYYTYMWSLVIAKDLWGQFADQPMDAAVAASYRKQILEPGGRQDAAELVQAFLGREYDFGAWESWLAAKA